MAVRIHRLAALSDIEALRAEMFAAVWRVGPRAVICGDYRFATPLAPDVADAWARGMREANRYIALSAALLDPENTMFNLQIERIVRCAGSAERRLFTEIDPLRDWMTSATGAALTRTELAELKAFVAEVEH